MADNFNIKKFLKENKLTAVQENDAWPFPVDSERVMQDLVDRALSGEDGMFDRLAYKTDGEEKKLNVVLNMIKNRLKERSDEISSRVSKEKEARFGRGGGQQTMAGTYTGD